MHSALTYELVLKCVSEYVVPIDSPLRQWLLESASILRYTYIACPVLFIMDTNLLLNLPLDVKLVVTGNTAQPITWCPVLGHFAAQKESTNKTITDSLRPFISLFPCCD